MLRSRVRVTRQDRQGRLAKAKRVNGRIIVPATLGRTGVQVYRNPDGSERREYRPPEEVFHADSIASLAGAPVTNLHPRSGKASREDQCGAVAGEVRKASDGRHLEADLALLDPELISDVDSGAKGEVSLGYDCRLDHAPGVSPEGEAYEYVQREIVYNHVAIVPRGRAGSAALRLDHQGNLTPAHTESQDMKFERIDGVEYEIGTPAHTAAVERQRAAQTATQKRLDAEEAERDSLRQKVQDLTSRLDASEKSVGERVKALVGLHDVARTHRVEVRLDMSEDEIRTAVLSKLLPSVDLKGKSSDYLAAALDIAVKDTSGRSAGSLRADAHDARRTTLDDFEADEDEDLPPDEKARLDALDRAKGKTKAKD